MESILAKKITTNLLFFIFWDNFIHFLILFVNLFQSYYLIFHVQQVARHYKEQNKKRIMTID